MGVAVLGMVARPRKSESGARKRRVGRETVHRDTELHQLVGLLTKAQLLLDRGRDADEKLFRTFQGTLRAFKQGDESHIKSHVLQPLVEPLGYARLEPAKPVTTRQGSEDAGFLFQAEGGAMLRAWVVFRETDRAQRVLLKQRERIALLTDGSWLRILVFDASGASITLAIKLRHWRKALLLPDLFRLLRALCQPYGVATIRQCRRENRTPSHSRRTPSAD
jgi:hypothetical protein